MFTISRIEESDLPALSDLYEELTDKKTDLQRMKESFRLINFNCDCYLLGAKENGALVGSLMAILCQDVVGECRPFMVLENVIVKSNVRGRGIGKAMIEFIEVYAREKACSYIILISAAERTGAHAFYKAQGYGMDDVRGFKKYL